MDAISLLRNIAQQFVDIRHDDLTYAEKLVVNLMIDENWLIVDEFGVIRRSEWNFVLGNGRVIAYR